MTLRALAFADVEAGLLGAAWIPEPGTSAPLAARAGSAADVLRAELEYGSEQWRITGDAMSLVVSPSGPQGSGQSRNGALASLDQLCSVSGRVRLGGADQDLRCAGWRAVLDGNVNLDRVDSFRQVCAWFDDGEGLSLLALRPRNSRGHESDLIAAAALDPTPGPAIADPRLSTTYTGEGVVLAAGLELWPDEETSRRDDDRHPAEHYPRRAAGEAVGPRLDWEVAGFELDAQLLRWHSRGRDGSGVYVLGRRR